MSASKVPQLQHYLLCLIPFLAFNSFEVQFIIYLLPFSAEKSTNSLLWRSSRLIKRVLVFCWSKELKLWVNFQLFLLSFNSTSMWFSVLMLVLSFLEDFWVNISGKKINSQGKIFQEVQASSVGLKTNFETLECGQFSSEKRAFEFFFGHSGTWTHALPLTHPCPNQLNYFLG